MTKQSIPYSLRHNEALRAGLVRILNAMGHDARYLAEQPESKLEKSVHDIRTLIKRLRAYLWFIRPAIGKALHAKGNAALRKAAQRLSEARDLHAVASALNKAAIPETDENHLQALARVSQTFAQQAAAAQKTDSSASALEKVVDTLVQAISKITWAVKRTSRELPSPGHRFKKALKHTRETMKETTRKKDPRLVHEWRKKTKILFYILQLTARLPHTGGIECLRKVDKLQEHLGDFQDNIVAENHLRCSSPKIDAAHLKRTLHLLRKKRKVLLAEAHHCWSSVLDEV
jgi:CHAD domain-containing protein